MTQALSTGASGLLAHQRKLDVVANNIANINTTSYKSQRVLFSDLVYSELREGQGATGDEFGGINPQQLGRGVSIAEFSKNFSQGIMTDTGQQFDFAIQGEGFFVVDSIGQNFTRDGSFSVDQNGYLVDPGTGAFVQRFGTTGDITDAGQGFQIPGDSRISIPLGATVPGQATSTTSFNGNLPASAASPVAEVLITASPFSNGGAPAVAGDLLNNLDSNTTPYQAGDFIEIVGTNADGSSFSSSFAVGPTTTLGDLVDEVNSQLTGASIAVSAEGNLEITADETGEAFLSLILTDASANTGETDLTRNGFVVETEGQSGGSFNTTLEVFDQRGEAYTIEVNFEKARC